MNSLDFFDTLAERERRRCSHVLAALRSALQDELEYEVDDDADDPRSQPLAPEHWPQVQGALYAAMSALMRLAHHAEAERIDAKIAASWDAHLQQVALEEEPPPVRTLGDQGWQRLSDAPEPGEHPFATWVREHVVKPDPDLEVWHRPSRKAP
jgi:hypothetical protein